MYCCDGALALASFSSVHTHTHTHTHTYTDDQGGKDCRPSNPHCGAARYGQNGDCTGYRQGAGQGRAVHHAGWVGVVLARDEQIGGSHAGQADFFQFRADFCDFLQFRKEIVLTQIVILFARFDFLGFLRRKFSQHLPTSLSLFLSSICVVLQAFRRSIGVRIKEETEVNLLWARPSCHSLHLTCASFSLCHPHCPFDHTF